MPCPQDDDPTTPNMKRSPLTPIPVDCPPRNDDDSKSTSSASYSSFSRSHSDDELRHRPSLSQRRKSSVTALTLPRPPYHRRRSHNRRASPARNSPGIPSSLTPIHGSFNSERRTSLPALHFHETVQNAVPLRVDTRSPSRRGSISEDIYGGLQSFTFGAPPHHSTHESDDSDEDERQRRDRAKMRAIDDGTRRPSLPTNSGTPAAPRSQPSLSSMASSAGIIVGERQWDEHSEPDWDVVMGDMGELTPTKTSPPPPPTPGSASTNGNGGQYSDPRRPSIPIDVPMLRRRSRSADELAVDFDIRMRGSTPTPTPLFSWVDRRRSRDDDVRGTSSSPEENPYEGLDLNFIYEQDPTAAKSNATMQHKASSSRLRSKFKKASNAPVPRAEDAFNAHVRQNDPVYERRMREWSFRREVRPGLHAHSKSKDRSGRASDEQDLWRCEWVGKFLVVKIRNDSGNAAMTSEPTKPEFNRLQILQLQDPSNKGSKSGGPRVLVHRHSRARAFSIFRGYMIPKKVMVPTDSVLLAVKSVLREYTRTESTRALKTHGLTDDGDVHSKRPHSQLRSGSGSSGDTPQESRRQRTRSKSSSRSRDNTVHEPSTPTAATFDSRTSSASGSNYPVHHSHSQPPEARSRKTSSRDASSPIPSELRPTTSSSISTSRPPSLALSRSSHSHSQSTPASSSVNMPPVPRWETPTPTSPRTSTSHAEAFAMRDLDTRHHHRDELAPMFPLPGAPVPPPRAAPLPLPATPSPPHGQRSTLGFGERIKRAFGSSKQPQPPKELKEPASPGTDDGEDEPKTATQDGKFAPPWLTVVRRKEKEQHDRMIRTLNDSFESVGLIPPQEKKKPSKPRSHKHHKNEECAVFEAVSDDSMCMLLPLWPEEPSHHSNGVSRHSSRSARHATTPSSGFTSVTTPIPLQERNFLLVYYVPWELESPTEDGANGGGNNKKRRRPQTAGDRPHHHHHNKSLRGPGSYDVIARLLGYNDVKSSGVRLPEKGLIISQDEFAMAVPLESPANLSPQQYSTIVATCYGMENGVELYQEALDHLGLLDPKAPRTYDANGDLTSVKLSPIGRAVVEMVWTGCVSLMAWET